jgi:5-methylcytosine-specific restriction endonuclease McrA
MPISKEKKKLYPKNWKTLSWQVRTEAGNKCELCDALNGKPHPITKSKVVLTVHHLDFNVRNNKRYNLIALCQRCHNRLDIKWRVYNRKRKITPTGK